MNRERLEPETFYGKSTSCKYCKKVIKHGQKTFVSRWIDRWNAKRFTRFCSEYCADEFYFDCLSRKSGVYF